MLLLGGQLNELGAPVGVDGKVLLGAADMPCHDNVLPCPPNCPKTKRLRTLEGAQVTSRYI